MCVCMYVVYDMLNVFIPCACMHITIEFSFITQNEQKSQAQVQDELVAENQRLLSERLLLAREHRQALSDHRKTVADEFDAKKTVELDKLIDQHSHEVNTLRFVILLRRCRIIRSYLFNRSGSFVLIYIKA